MTTTIYVCKNIHKCTLEYHIFSTCFVFVLFSKTCGFLFLLHGCFPYYATVSRFLVLFNRTRVYLFSSLGVQSCEQTSFLINIHICMNILWSFVDQLSALWAYHCVIINMPMSWSHVYFQFIVATIVAENIFLEKFLQNLYYIRFATDFKLFLNLNGVWFVYSIYDTVWYSISCLCLSIWEISIIDLHLQTMMFIEVNSLPK